MTSTLESKEFKHNGIKFMKNIYLCALSLVFLQMVHASTEVAKILSKSNRTLSNPPTALKADSESKDFRIATGIKRTQAALSNEEKLENVPVERVVEPEAVPQNTSGYYEPQSSVKYKNSSLLSDWIGDRNFGVGM
jgi:hypothetical protein